MDEKVKSEKERERWIEIAGNLNYRKFPNQAWREHDFGQY